MTTRNLDALFRPASIALIGASNQAGSIGEVLSRNLLENGFAGPIMPVNPKARAVRSTVAYPSVAELPMAPDLAVIATPPASVPGLVAELGERGCRAAVVISSGFEASSESGRALRQALLEAARPHLLRVVGPNCLGFISPGRGINASFAHLTPKPGSIALVSQSGAVAAAAIDWAEGRSIGFSHVISIGDAADVDVGDLLDYLATDTETRAILLYVESITDARKFMSAGRIAARAKPVVVIKTGRSASGAKAAFSHTGAMAGADAVYDAAFRRAGMLRVGDLRELFDAAETLSRGLTVDGGRLAIMTNGGGAGVMAVDALEGHGGRLAELAPETAAAIRQAAPRSVRANPVDLLGDAPASAYSAAMTALQGDPGVDAILAMNCPTAATSSTDAAQAVLTAASAGPSKPLITCWLGDAAVAPAREAFARAGVPTFETPEEAVRAFQHLLRFRDNQKRLLRTPRSPATAAGAAGARRVIEQARRSGRTILTDPEARELLAAYGIPVVESRTVTTPDEAGLAAEAMGARVALKILSPDISHKSDVGGVQLGLSGRAAVAQAAAEMLERVRHARPEARIEGFVLEPMVDRPHAQELIAGITIDPTFGPVVLFGQGGVATEVLADRSLGLPPLDDALTREMVAETRVARLLAGFRDRAPADLGALDSLLITLGQLATDCREIVELDINPLLAGADGVFALDARVRLAAEGEPPVRVAILPYPAHLERQVAIDGRPAHLRPVRPDDAAKLVELVDRSTPDDVHARFAGGLRHLSPEFAARLAQIDYDRHLALVIEGPEGDLWGVGRLVSDPAGESAEFALLIRSDMQHRGIGGRLLDALVDHARETGLARVWGEVARANSKMLVLAAEHGFTLCGSDDPVRARVELVLPAASPDTTRT